MWWEYLAIGGPFVAGVVLAFPLAIQENDAPSDSDKGTAYLLRRPGTIISLSPFLSLSHEGFPDLVALGRRLEHRRPPFRRLGSGASPEGLLGRFPALTDSPSGPAAGASG